MNGFTIMGATLFALAVAGEAHANMLVNGSLETTVPLNPFGMVYMSRTRNPTALPGWTISSGTIDIVPNNYFQSSLPEISAWTWWEPPAWAASR